MSVDAAIVRKALEELIAHRRAASAMVHATDAEKALYAYEVRDAQHALEAVR